MAFSSSSKQLNVIGNKKMEIVSFSAASVTTGVISSKLSVIDSVLLHNVTSGEVAGQKAVASGSNVTITGVNSNDVGEVVIFGY